MGAPGEVGTTKISSGVRRRASMATALFARGLCEIPRKYLLQGEG